MTTQTNIGEPVTLGEGGAARPLRALGLGPVYSRFTGEMLADVTAEKLREYARVINERIEHDRVIFDWQHATALSAPPTSPEISMALGEVLRAWVEDDALYIQPRWTPRAEHIITQSDGLLWLSPEFVDSPVFARESGEPVGSGQVLAITLTPRPQQVASAIDAVRLNEEAPLEAQEVSGMTPEEIAALEAERDELKAMVAELEAKIAAMDDAEEMGEEGAAESAPAVAALTEQLSSRDAEVSALREQVGALDGQLAALREEAYAAKRSHAIDRLVAAGKLTPAEVEVATRDYDIEHKHPELGYKAFSERYENRTPVIDMGVRGIAGDTAGPDAGAAMVKLREAAETIRSEKGCDWPTAMKLAQKDNPADAAAYFGN